LRRCRPRQACDNPVAADQSSHSGRAAYDEQQIALFDDVLIRPMGGQVRGMIEIKGQGSNFSQNAKG
jgi:hypothetical protein